MGSSNGTRGWTTCCVQASGDDWPGKGRLQIGMKIWAIYWWVQLFLLPFYPPAQTSSYTVHRCRVPHRVWQPPHGFFSTK